jgi:acyl-CoA thioesterase FadM
MQAIFTRYLILEIDWRVKIGSAPVKTSRRVSWNDCDPSGRIRFQAVFDWFVDAEVEFLRELGIVEAFGTMPRVAAEAEYTLGLWYDDAVELEVGVAEIGRSSVRYRFVVRSGGEEAANGTVKCVYVVDGRSATLPDPIRAALEGAT